MHLSRARGGWVGLLGAFLLTSLPRLTSCELVQFAMGVQNFTLPKLPYAYNALEPSISEEIMRLHHTRHHQAYVDNLNAANLKLSVMVQNNDVAGQVALQEDIKFNGGGHINHALFWKNLAPVNSPESNPEVALSLVTAISETWGGLPQFKTAFSAALLSIKGSGWGWLVRGGPTQAENALRIITTKDQDPPVGRGMLPVMGVDMWEHAYYPQYQNGKAAYVENIWSVINWHEAETRYLSSADEVLMKL